MQTNLFKYILIGSLAMSGAYADYPRADGIRVYNSSNNRGDIDISVNSCEDGGKDVSSDMRTRDSLCKNAKHTRKPDAM